MSDDPLKAEMLGDIGPEDEAPELLADEATPDTETETEEAVVSSDTETETDDNQQGDEESKEEKTDDDPLDQYGLRGKYNSVDDALRSIPERDSYVGRIEQSERNLRNLLERVATDRPQPAKTEGLSREQLDELLQTDPDRAFQELGYVKKDDVAALHENIKQMQSTLQQQQFIGATERHEELRDVAAHMRSTGMPPRDGVNPMWDRMNSIFNQRPGLQRLPQADALDMCYDLAKAELAAQGKPTVPKISDAKKRGATTTSRSHGGQKDIGDVPDFGKMNDTEIERWFKKRGLVT